MKHFTLYLNFFYVNRKVINHLRSYVIDGDITQAEPASIVLGNMKNADAVLMDLVDNLCDGLKLNKPNLLATLSCLSQFAMYTPNVITPVIDLVADFVEKNLLTARTKTVICRVNF